MSPTITTRYTLPTITRQASVSIVVPTLNEARNLPRVFEELPADAEIVLVDGGSVDDTVAVAQTLRPDVVVVRQTRKGKGNALACGFAASTGEHIVMIDADGSADPTEIPRFIDALRGGADFAKGSRFAAGGGSEITPLRRLGHKGLNGLANVLFGTHFTDLCYGYNAFQRSILIDLALPAPDLPAPPGGTFYGDGFEAETLIDIRVAKAGRHIAEVPSVEAPRQFGGTNPHAVRDGLRVLRAIMREFVAGRPLDEDAEDPGVTAEPRVLNRA